MILLSLSGNDRTTVDHHRIWKLCVFCLAFKYFLKRVSFGSKECTIELKLECAYFCHLGFISDPLIVSKFNDETYDPKGQENKIYTIVKGRETFYRRHTVPVTSCSKVKYVLKRLSKFVPEVMPMMTMIKLDTALTLRVYIVTSNLTFLRWSVSWS